MNSKRSNQGIWVLFILTVLFLCVTLWRADGQERPQSAIAGTTITNLQTSPGLKNVVSGPTNTLTIDGTVVPTNNTPNLVTLPNVNLTGTFNATGGNVVTKGQYVSDFLAFAPYGLYSWWRADSFSYFGFTNGTTTNVWVDAYNNIVLSPRTGSMTYNPNVQNGFPGMYFNSTAISNTAYFGTSSLNTNCTIVVVFKNSAYPGPGTLGCLLSDSGPFYYLAGWSSIGPSVAGGGGIMSVSGTASTGAPLNQQYETDILQVRWENGQQKMWVNGATAADSRVYANGQSFINTGLTNDLIIGAYKDNTSPFNGYISDVLVFSNLVTDAQQQDIYNRLSTRYQLQGPSIFVVGDSLSQGFGPSVQTNLTMLLAQANPNSRVKFVGYSGMTSGHMLTNMTSWAGQIRKGDIVTWWSGANDDAALWTFSQSTNFIMQAASIVHSNAGLFLVCTMPSEAHETNDTLGPAYYRTNFNNAITANYQSFADGIIPLGSSPIYGQVNQFTNGAYFEESGAAAGVHYSNAWVYIDMVTNYFQPAINLVKNKGFQAPSAKIAGNLQASGQVQSELGAKPINVGLWLDVAADATNAGYVYSRSPYSQFGTVDYHETWTNSYWGPGMFFNWSGGGQGIDFGTNFPTMQTNTGTLNLIFAANNTTQIGVSTNGLSLGFFMNILSGTVYCYLNGNANCQYSTNLLDGNRHMATFTYDGANGRLYVDGNKMFTTALSGGIVVQPTNHFVLLSSGGTILGAQEWGRALTDDEVSRWYFEKCGAAGFTAAGNIAANTFTGNGSGLTNTFRGFTNGTQTLALGGQYTVPSAGWLVIRGVYTNQVNLWFSNVTSHASWPLAITSASTLTTNSWDDTVPVNAADVVLITNWGSAANVGIVTNYNFAPK